MSWDHTTTRKDDQSDGVPTQNPQPPDQRERDARGGIEGERSCDDCGASLTII
jgi:hypothetical protein